MTARQCSQRQWQPSQERRRRLQPVRAEAAEQDTAAPVESAESGVQRCKLCGVDLASAPRGCDNEGHVIKGLGSWPGFGWFEALRVYGACPEAQKKGIAYTRKGDTLDEIMFGKK